MNPQQIINAGIPRDALEALGEPAFHAALQVAADTHMDALADDLVDGLQERGAKQVGRLRALEILAAIGWACEKGRRS